MSKAIRNVVLMAVAFGAGAPLAIAGDVDIGITITGEITPGVYGRVDLSNRPPPPVVYVQPVVIEPLPAEVRIEPIYLHVPPDHARNWRRYCHEYHACNRPVYFVRSAEYEPGYEREKEGRHEHQDGEHHDRDHDRHDHEHHDD
jgi:hypothetical protein